VNLEPFSIHALSIAPLACAAVMLASDQSVGPSRESASTVRLTNVAEAAGLRFVYQHSPTAEKYFVESVPGGVAVFDYNGDGRPDIFFTNGAKTPALDKVSPIYSNRLYRNDGGMRFTDVTTAAGVSGAGYAIGAAAGDFDNDGHVDLFVAGARANQLYRNRGDGRFEDVTRAAGIAGDDFSVGGGWLDYDNDGRLDLLVLNYVQWSPDTNPSCGDEARRIKIYCHPRMFKGLPNRLYRNRGDRTFEDVSARAGLQAHVGKAMSASFADFDHDGRLDVFVTNDAMPNFLFRNNGDGTFTETALLAGVSVPDTGRPTSSMGVDAQDYDNDGWEDIQFTALTGETFPLFRNESAGNRGTFVEMTQPSGLAALTVKSSGWCSILADLDNDGWKDLFFVNGHVYPEVDVHGLDETYAERSLVLRNQGDGRFVSLGGAAGEALDRKRVGRGAAFGDCDGDGRVDIVMTSVNDEATLLRNVSLGGHGWLAVDLVGRRSNRDGIGARITAQVGGRRLTQEIHGGASYLSQSDLRAHFGLGAAETVSELEVRWPSGVVDRLRDVRGRQVVTVEEGRGVVSKRAGRPPRP
jgi:enediyne biosynthesis protein E4